MCDVSSIQFKKTQKLFLSLFQISTAMKDAKTAHKRHSERSISEVAQCFRTLCAYKASALCKKPFTFCGRHFLIPISSLPTLGKSCATNTFSKKHSKIWHHYVIKTYFINAQHMQKELDVQVYRQVCRFAIYLVVRYTLSIEKNVTIILDTALPQLLRAPTYITTGRKQAPTNKVLTSKPPSFFCHLQYEKNQGRPGIVQTNHKYAV